MNFLVETKYKFYTISGEYIFESKNQPECFTGIIEYSDINEKYSCVEYWLSGDLHRIGGPAVKYSDIQSEYYIHGKQITKKEHDLLCLIMKLKGLI